jgi:hypothetical protein
MISSVSGISFRSNDLINSPSKYSVTAQTKPMISKSFDNEDFDNKKSHIGTTLLATGAVALATFAGLGYAVKTGHLEKVNIAEGEGFFNTLWPKTKNLAYTIGEKAQTCWETVAGWFGKKAKDAK